MRLMGYLAGAYLVLSLVSCAAFGTKVKVIEPERLSSLKTIAVWPTAVTPPIDGSGMQSGSKESTLAIDPGLRAYAADLSQRADWALVENLQASGLFTIIAPDSIIRLVTAHQSGFSRFGGYEWKGFRGAIDAGAIIIAGFSFKGEGSGTNTYVTLSIFDTKTANQIMEVKFNTKWGKSYGFPKPADETLPDAIQGAVNGLVNKLRNDPAFKRSDSGA